MTSPIEQVKAPLFPRTNWSIWNFDNIRKNFYLAARMLKTWKIVNIHINHCIPPKTDEACKKVSVATKSGRFFNPIFDDDWRQLMTLVLDNKQIKSVRMIFQNPENLNYHY